jgi:hypothetical protein
MSGVPRTLLTFLPHSPILYLQGVPAPEYKERRMRMTKDQLNAKLSESLKEFSKDLHANYKEDSNEPITEADLHVLARDISYVMDDFRKYILEYLE